MVVSATVVVVDEVVVDVVGAVVVGSTVVVTAGVPAEAGSSLLHADAVKVTTTSMMMSFLIAVTSFWVNLVLGC